MARIPEAEIERLKREISLERLVEARGVVLKRKGADLVGRCPFGTHADAEPSFVVTPAKNLWHCFGCQQGGSVIDWVMRVEGVSFRHAVELLRDDNASLVTAAMIVPAGPRTQLTREGLGLKRSTVPKLESPVDLKVDDRDLLGQVIDYYHETLKESPEALAYLQKRGIGLRKRSRGSSSAMRTARWGIGCRQKNRVEGAAIRGQLQRVGLYARERP